MSSTSTTAAAGTLRHLLAERLPAARVKRTGAHATAALVGALAGGLALGLAGGLAALQWHLIRRAASAARLDGAALPIENHPARSRLRVLMVGDSTGVGVGIADARSTLPGLLAARLHDVEIVNLCASGARVGNVVQQLAEPLQASQRFDLLLVFAGGNDVLRATPLRALASDARTLSLGAARLAPQVLWLGSADVGTAPVFLPPLAWWLSWRSRRVARLLAVQARRAGVDFVDFASAPHGSLFARHTRRYFAADGLHPSASANAYCLRVLMQRPALRKVLSCKAAAPARAAVPAQAAMSAQ